MTRQLERRLLRKMGEFVARKTVPLTRAQRRLAGKVYGNAAYRAIRGLEHELYGGAEHGYMKYKAHVSIVRWIMRERERLGEHVQI